MDIPSIQAFERVVSEETSISSNNLHTIQGHIGGGHNQISTFRTMVDNEPTTSINN